MVALLALCLLLCTAYAVCSQCEVPLTSGIKFSIISERNQTGQWTAKVKQELGEVAGKRVSGPWNLDVGIKSVQCENNENVVMEASITGPPPGLGPDYKLIHNLGYYKMHTEGKPWYDAVRICAEEGAHLAILNSEREVQELLKMWAPFKNHFPGFEDELAFIGFHDFKTAGQFVTIFGQPLTSQGYLKWAPNEPSNGQGEFCGMLQRNGELHEGYCFHDIVFFCEREL
ncbi:hemolymph lipopolysaccharide-binding protein-like isoform X2 [Periplaneta americana]